MGQETKHGYVGRKVLRRSYQKHVCSSIDSDQLTLFHRDKAYLESLVAEAEEAVQGKRVSKEDELDEPADKTEKKL